MLLFYCAVQGLMATNDYERNQITGRIHRQKRDTVNTSEICLCIMNRLATLQSKLNNYISRFQTTAETGSGGDYSAVNTFGPSPWSCIVAVTVSTTLVFTSVVTYSSQSIMPPVIVVETFADVRETMLLLSLLCIIISWCSITDVGIKSCCCCSCNCCTFCCCWASCWNTDNTTLWVNSRCAIAAWLECFQEKPRTVSEWTGLPGEESVKRFERSNGLDTALYKIIPFLPFNSSSCNKVIYTAEANVLISKSKVRIILICPKINKMIYPRF